MLKVDFRLRQGNCITYGDITAKREMANFNTDAINLKKHKNFEGCGG
jgi:hypothetical protein